ncbi:Na(+)/H(+) exchange regulatory cofactor NHE-RF4 [Sorex araneus]|uniref:Na(+)/H(+) exchange regulatory cofactor NHE-RF4 n=1 Tax=Sorex araneus TaxID=42254 RepID=UPI0003318A3E|nr:Na(+)/H(+) exchange regulatory cofactor NHE-RF4 [Sorex araneus]
MEAVAELPDTASLTLKFEFNPKLGIDNPALCLTEDLDPSDTGKLKPPRFCLLSKDASGNFGFHLQHHLARPQPVVSKVDPGSSAQRQGLQEGDLILGVNHNMLEQEDFAAVVRHIRASGPRVLLMVMAQHVYDVARERQGDKAPLYPTLGPEVRPRLCHVVKDEGGFGFSVTSGYGGSFWLVLSSGGAAERAGVPAGARLLEVNGASVEKLTQRKVNKKLSQSGQQVTLLVAATEVEEQCRRLGVPLAAPLAEGWTLPVRPRCLNLEKGPQGFGFLLKEEKRPDGSVGQFLREVDPGRPAEKAGMRDGDRLVAVAGDSVEGLSHEETVSRIRAQGLRVALTVVDPETDRFFNTARLSPLLFMEPTETPAAQDEASQDQTKSPPSADTPTSRAPVPGATRLCILHPGPGGGYGFWLSCVTSWPRLYISKVLPGGAADQAGLRQGDVVLEVNGCAIDDDNEMDILNLLLEADPPLSLKLAVATPGQDSREFQGEEEDWTFFSKN